MHDFEGPLEFFSNLLMDSFGDWEIA